MYAVRFKQDMRPWRENQVVALSPDIGAALVADGFAEAGTLPDNPHASDGSFIADVPPVNNQPRRTGYQTKGAR